MEEPSSAAKALKTALRWQSIIDEEGVNRAEIALREGLTRARVTQLMKLVHLPDEVRAGVKAGDESFAGWSIRQAIELAAQGGVA